MNKNYNPDYLEQYVKKGLIWNLKCLNHQAFMLKDTVMDGIENLKKITNIGNDCSENKISKEDNEL